MLRMHPGRAHIRPWLRRLLLSTAWVRLAAAPPHGFPQRASVHAAQQQTGKHGAASIFQRASADRLQRFRRLSSTAAGEEGLSPINVGLECSEDGSLEAERAGDDAEGSAAALPSKGRLDPGLYLVATPIGTSKTCV